MKLGCFILFILVPVLHCFIVVGRVVLVVLGGSRLSFLMQRFLIKGGGARLSSPEEL